MADAEVVPDGSAVAEATTAAPIAPANASVTPPASNEMTLVDHLSELRSRLVKILIAVGLGSVVGFWFWRDIRNFLIAPLPTGTVQVLGPGDAFVIAMRISIITGIILAMPVILWQVWRFVSPGLTDPERRMVRPWIPLALLFFAIGVAIAYVILPFATGFLLAFTDNVLVANLAAGPYFDFVTTMFLVFGLIMEFPILLYGLSRVGIVTSARLTGSRRMIILGIAIFATAITPGGDLVSPTVLGVTMYVLFEGTVFFIRRSGR
jgi:sec-independent protein translocase protein TatC